MKKYGNLSAEEAINLLILSLKAAGFNDSLVADGTLGKEVKKAAAAHSSFDVGPYGPITSTLRFLQGCKNPNRIIGDNIALREFLSDNGCPLG